MQEAQQDAWAQRSVRRGAARRDGQDRSNAASEFSPFVPNFSLVPSCEGKIRYVPEKNGTEGKIRSQVADRWAGAGRECRAGIAGRAGMGRAGGGTCVFLHKYVRRNRLGCRFGAEHRGKNPYYSLDFFREVQDISLIFPDFFRGKIPANSREESGAITNVKP